MLIFIRKLYLSFISTPIILHHALQASWLWKQISLKSSISSIKCSYEAKYFFCSSSGNLINLNVNLSNQPLVKFTNRDRILNVLPCAVRRIHQNPWLASEARSWKAVSVWWLSCGWWRRPHAPAHDSMSCLCWTSVQSSWGKQDHTDLVASLFGLI